MVTEYLLPPDVRVIYTDEPGAFGEEKAAGSCILTTLSSGLAGADAYVEKEEDLDELSEDFLIRIYDRHLGRPHVVARFFAAGGELVLRELTGQDYEAFLLLSSQGGTGLAGMEDPQVYQKELEQYRAASQEAQQRAREQFGQTVGERYRMLDSGLWMITRGGRPIGLAGLMAEADGMYLGYLVEEASRGQGIATLVCREILRYAKEELGITELFAKAAPDNLPSLAVLRHLGAVSCGDERRACCRL